jgi:hypothetical protein
MANAAAVAIVQSCLDYANALLCGTSSSIIHKLQRVPDTLSRLVINQSNISSAERFYNLDWLLITHQLQPALLTYKTITLHHLSYLSSLLSPHSTS